MKVLYIVIWIIVSWIFALLVDVKAFEIAKSSKPAQFWPVIKIKVEDLINLKEYNLENGNMWFSYSLFFWLNGIIGAFNRRMGALFLVLCIFPGCIMLAFRYNKIYKKYEKKVDSYER